MDILKELEDAYFDIPFENSDFQNKVFGMSINQTSARAYRAIGLRMFSRLAAIEELKHSRALEDIDIEEMEENFESQGKYEQRRTTVEIAKKLSTRNYTDKLLNDALHELNFMYTEFKKFPTFTREEFEAQELNYFDKKFTRTLECRGNATLESAQTLLNMEKFDEVVKVANEYAKIK